MLKNNQFQSLRKRIGFTEILFILFFLSIFLFIFLYFHNTKKWIEVEMKVTTDTTMISEWRSAPRWLIDTVKIGDKEYDGFGQPVAEVEDIHTYETPGSYKETYIKLRLNVLYNKNQHKYTYSSKDLTVGGPMSVKPNGILIEGVVTAIQGISDNRKKVHKKVLLQMVGGPDYITNGVEPWIADAVSVGDEMKDFNGSPIAKVLEKRVEPAKRITIDASGVPHLTRDPYLVDLYTVMDLLTTEDKGIYYFKEDEPIKINQTVTVISSKYDINWNIVNILN
ncbi:MAG: DUF4330 domain-containing protein [Patescibacteria group bacterium]|nr:DUF4330 domain-containing protein [Patescibacteria group bacterium]